MFTFKFDTEVPIGKPQGQLVIAFLNAINYGNKLKFHYMEINNYNKHFVIKLRIKANNEKLIKLREQNKLIEKEGLQLLRKSIKCEGRELLY